MKPYLFASLLVLAGCQSTPSVPTTTPPPNPAVMPRPAPLAAVPALPPTAELERKVRQQAQYIEALVSQNDAFKARIAATPMPTAASAPTPPPAPVPSAVQPALPAPIPTEEPALVPNAEGIIDLTAVAAKPGEPVNPFAVRAAPDGPTREVLLHVSGLIAGPGAYAVLNERLVQAGDAVESFQVERVDPEAVSLRLGERRLRLPLSEKPVRVCLPL